MIPLVLTVLPAGAMAQKSCESLKDLSIPNVTITSAVSVPEGVAAARAGVPAPQVSLPEHCVIQAVARPTSDSEIHFEVWLPTTTWNGKYQQWGNGGWAGSIPTMYLPDSLKRGYAVAATDDGHKGGSTDSAWATGHPEKLIDFAYRAVHETNMDAHAIVQAFYGKDAQKSYFVGCSDGGREALMEAQRFPEDFDGIVAGAPANNWSGLSAAMVWDEQALLGTPGSAIPPAKLAAIQKAALDACDALDGVKDGLVEEPRVCHFNPDVLACKQGTDATDCLTPPQLTALKKIYAGPKDPRDGKQIYPGLAQGTENGMGGWSVWVAAPKPENALQIRFANSYYGPVVNEQSKWDFRKMTFTTELEYAFRKDGWLLDATSPDLRSFRDHHGKLIQYHGWGDPALSPYGSIAYYESVENFLTNYPDPRVDTSKPVSDFYRLFMVPGLGHCALGAGPNRFGNPMQVTDPNDPERDVLAALDRWVETGVAPDHIIGQGSVPGDSSKKLTRPLCPYPQVARYKGAGDPYDSASFECAVPAADK
ncbi:MAG TPA: tannase/feruloyl esterase family alpha/beta hydrolase [Terracidiphilus sp.]|nr:tannase/feruloyl esterase family alpha/beta hydrolase [Terracidiphilus sp.]